MNALLAGVAVILALLAHPRAARACDCGRVIAVRAAPGPDDLLVDLFVIRAWKGATAGAVVTLPIDASSCGYFAVPGDDLLIYAPVATAVRQCAGADTARVRWGADIDADAAVLGPPTSVATPLASFRLAADVIVTGKVVSADAGPRGRVRVEVTRATRGARRRQTLEVISATGACAIAPPAVGRRIALRAARVQVALVVAACAAGTEVRTLGRAARP
jgi:hypothetical protein